MKTNNKERYEVPAATIVEVKEDIAQMAQNYE